MQDEIKEVGQRNNTTQKQSNEAKENDPLLQKTALMSYCQAIKETLNEGIPNCLGRVVSGSIGFVNGIILSKLGPTQIAAGPLITTFTYVTIGTARGMFLSTGIVTGNLKGAKEYSKIGDVVRQSWIFGTIVTIPASAILLSTRYILGLTGTSNKIAEVVQEFFIPYCAGILPSFLFLNDQQFAVGIGRPSIVLASSTIYTVVNISCSSILGLGLFNLPKLGVSGMGWGASIAAWVTLFAIRGYFLRDGFRNFERVLILSEANQDLPEIEDLIVILGKQDLKRIAFWKKDNQIQASQDLPEIDNATVVLQKQGLKVTAFWKKGDQIAQKTLKLENRRDILLRFSAENQEIEDENFVTEIALMFNCIHFKPYNLFKGSLRETFSYFRYARVLMLLEGSQEPERVERDTIVLQKKGSQAIAFWQEGRQVSKKILDLNEDTKENRDILTRFSSDNQEIKARAFVSQITLMCGLAPLKELIILGWKTGLQVTAEWGNFTILTLMMGKLGQSALTAEQVSIQYMNAYTLVILGLAQATGVLVSRTNGKRRKAIEEKKPEAAIVYKKNTRTLGNAGIFVGFTTSLVICSLFIGIPKQLSSVFIETNEQNHEVLVLAQAMLFVNGIGLAVDSIRNMGAGALRGYKDVMIATILGIVGMSVLGLSCGYGLAFPLAMGPNYLFITRDVGIILAAIGTVYRWLQMSAYEADTFDESNNRNRFFGHSATVASPSPSNSDEPHAQIGENNPKETKEALSIN